MGVLGATGVLFYSWKVLRNILSQVIFCDICYVIGMVDMLSKERPGEDENSNQNRVFDNMFMRDNLVSFNGGQFLFSWSGRH